MITTNFWLSERGDVPSEYCVDLHVKVISDRIVERAKRFGLDALVYAPHFTPLPEIERRAARYSDDEVTVIPAREVFTGRWTNRKHVLALGLDEPIPDFISLAGAMDELARQGAVVLVPHPDFATVSLGPDEIRRYRETIDALEVFNPKHLPTHNRRARRLSSELDVPPFTSSYAHLARSVGLSRTVFETSIDDEDALLQALRTGADRRIEHATSVRRWVGTAAELAHLGWENTWKKGRRLCGPGIEPTHPDVPLYGGRFDSVCVY